MAQLKSFCKKIILSIIMISIIISSCAVPNSYAKLAMQDGEFYYAGTTKGSYVPSEGIFSWLFDILAKIATFLLTLIPNVLRMAFVGYAAGAEKILTWALESTAGVNLQGEDINATDLSKLSDSTNNVTVQAIVYNMVPALNVNFFDAGKDRTELYIKEIKEKDADGNLETKKVVISPTGQQLICKKCGKSVLECCGELGDDNKEIKCYGTGGTNGDCGCNGCEACKKYAQLMLATDPIIVQLKTLIAVWYYLIRLLAVAAMAVVLIAIGIKMAISTIASDKAVYKRMLVDWIVGVILIFTMHYIMYFAITVNEILVNTIRESANAVNRVQLAQLADGGSKDDGVEKSNQDIEIDVYEEIRTRAYDMKMTVGLMGMIMYFAMVFMAFKYTLIYIKRFLTLAVLTLMAPGLGVSYALQKALSGKSSSLKTWLTEYILNLVIQVVHALIYAIFISAALAYSLENVSGVILALILMNFSLKAEGIFRRIFNLDPGNKGLLGSTETAGDKDKLMNNVKTMKGIAMGAKPVANALTKPVRMAAGTAGRGAAALGLAGTAKALDKFNSSERVQKGKQAISDKFDKGKQAVSDKMDSIKRGEGVSGKIFSAGKTIAKPVTMAGKFIGKHMPKTQWQEDGELLKLGQVELEKELEEAKKDYVNDDGNKYKARRVLEANRKLERHRELTGRQADELTVKDVAVGHVKGLFDVNNYFNVKISADGKKHYEMKSGLVFGTRRYNAETGKFEKDNSNAAYTQLGASKLLGFTDKDKKIFKEQIMSPAIKGFGGMAAMFMGMGTFVGHPVIGMGLLAGGMGTTTSMLKKFRQPRADAQGRLKCIHRVKGKILPTRRYKFGSFTSPTVSKMRDEIVMQANRELAKQLTSNIEYRHPGFSERIRNDLLTPKTIVPAIGGGIALATLSLPAGILTAAAIRKKMTSRKQDPRNGKYININDPYQLEEDRSQVRLHPVGQSALEVVDSHHFQQLEEQLKEFNDEAGDVMNMTILENGNMAQRNIIKQFNQKVDSSSAEEADKMAIDIYALMGFDYDPKTGVKTSKTNDLDVNKRDIVKDVEITDKAGKTTKKEITNEDINNINKALNDAILSRVAEKVERNEELDVNDEAMLLDIINEVSSKPEIKQLLSSDQGVEVLFKGNMSALKNTIKDKATSANNVAKNEIAKNLQLNGEEFDVVKESIMEVAKASASKDGKVDMSTLDQDKIFAKIQDKMNLTQPDQTAQQDKKSSKKTDKVNTNVDQLLVKSKEATYKKAISTLLTTDSPKGLNVNVKSQNAKGKMNSMLNLQTGSDPLQIRSRMTTESVSKSVSFEKKPTKEQLKRKAKKSVIEILDAYAGNTDSSSKPEEEMTPLEKTKKNIAQAKAKEKLKQAQTATQDLDSILGDTILESLFAMNNTQTELKELNEYAHENFSQKSKFKKGAKYLRAVRDLSEARIEVNRIEMTEKVTGKKVDSAKKQKAQLNKLLAEEKISTVGPVSDTVKATNDIIAEMKKRI